MDWNDDALAALKKDVPFFVRPAVRRRVESMAAEESRESIDLSFYQQAMDSTRRRTAGLTKKGTSFFRAAKASSFQSIGVCR